MTETTKVILEKYQVRKKSAEESRFDNLFEKK